MRSNQKRISSAAPSAARSPLRNNVSLYLIQSCIMHLLAMAWQKARLAKSLAKSGSLISY
jgi:hypothetical protein